MGCAVLCSIFGRAEPDLFRQFVEEGAKLAYDQIDQGDLCEILDGHAGYHKKMAELANIVCSTWDIGVRPKTCEGRELTKDQLGEDGRDGPVALHSV